MEEKIIQLLREEDPPTQKRVYYEHCDRLMAVVYPYLGSVADAEEVLQDTFLTIFQKIASFDTAKGSFYSWTHRIAVNTALMFLRKKKRMIFTREDITTLPITDQLISHPKQLEESDLEFYLNKLSPKSAIIFRLKAIEGYNHEEIAQLLRIPSVNSRAIFSRARKKLQKYLINAKASV